MRTRHSRKCASRTGARCNSDPTYEAWVFDKRTVRHQKQCASRSGSICDCKPQKGVKIRKQWPTLAAAKSWRIDALKGVKDKTIRAF